MKLAIALIAATFLTADIYMPAGVIIPQRICGQ